MHEMRFVSVLCSEKGWDGKGVFVECHSAFC